MKKVSTTSLPVGVAVFLALLLPGSAFAATDSGAASSNGSSYTVSVESSGEGNVDMSFERSSIRNTGPDSDNKLTTTVTDNTTVTNTNDVNLDLNNQQTAVSGKAVVSDNTTGGNATSGDAKNTNTTRVNVDVNNTPAPCDCKTTPVTPTEPGGRGGNPGGNVLGVSTTTQPTGRGGAVMSASLPPVLPATGPATNLWGILISFLASALTYGLMVRRSRPQETTAGSL